MIAFRLKHLKNVIYIHILACEMICFSNVGHVTFENVSIVTDSFSLIVQSTLSTHGILEMNNQ